MGASGAGKTSLLSVLNGQHSARLDERTRIYLSSKVPITTCFITQDVSGHLFCGLTAEQMLYYASRLKNRVWKDGHAVDDDQRHRDVAHRLLEKFNLTACATTKVQHCSGGERKRLALAVELTAEKMPNLICFDEISSGLDSNTAEIVIRQLLYGMWHSTVAY